MCETMTAMEGVSSYILTEDMIDAAMTEQLFQVAGESDDESSQEDVEMHSSSNEDTSDKDLNQPPDPDSAQTPVDDSEALCEKSTDVIDSGLGERGINELNIISETRNSENVESGEIQLPAETPLTNTNIPPSCNQIVDSQNVVMNDSDDVKEDGLPESVHTSNKIPPGREPGALQIVESIDLCNSDSEELSADDAPTELIDGDLQSVMESNLMAEIGMKLPTASADLEPTDPVMPKISVKNIGHISANDFDKIPSNTLDLPHVNVEKRRSLKVVARSPEISIPSKDAPSTIQLNKIAMPNKTFVDSQGRKMKCVYVRGPTNLPVNVTNDNPSLVGKQNIKYMLAPAKIVNGTLQLRPTPVEPLKTKVPQVKAKPGNSKKLMIAPKLIKGPDVLKRSPDIQRFDKAEINHTLVKSLMFHSLKTPYIPPETFVGEATHCCIDCNDRFILELSLKHHLARRTIIINYWCRICKVQIQCFNRCVFLSHLRGHNISKQAINSACISFFPITEEMSGAGLVSTYFTEESGNLPKKEALHMHSKVVTNANYAPPKPTGKPAPQERPVPQETPVTNSIFTYSNENAPTVSKGYSKISVKSKSLGTFISAPVNNSVLLSNDSNSAQDQPVKVATPVDKSIRTFYNQTAATVEASTANGIPNVIPPNVVCEMVTQENGEVKDNNNGDVEGVKSTPVDNKAQLAQQGNQKVAAKKSNNSKKPKISLQNDLEQASSSKRICTECKLTVVNISKHLNGSTRILNPMLECEVCHLVLPTRCALSIHLRMHMQVAPFKCPDCGKEFSTVEEQIAHLKYACGHLAKCMRFMCACCKTHFPSTSALANHISSQHSKDIYKCTACPVAFFNKSSLTKHLCSHPNNSAIGMDYKQCSICPKKVVPKERFMEHVDEHIRNRSILIYGFKCPMCSVIFANKMPFIIHQMKEKEQMEGKSESVLKPVFMKKTACPGPAPLDPSSELEDEPEIISKYPEMFNGNTEEKDPLSLDGCELPLGQTVNEKKEELCIVCKKNYVVLLPDIDLNKQSLCCRQCVRPLDEVADKPSNSCGKSRPKSLSQTKRRSSDISVKSDMPNGLKNCIESSSPKKKYRKKSSAIIWDPFDPLVSTQVQGQVITSKSPNELICSKCDFTTKVRDVFLEHISVHRTDPSTFQCMECGLCFVVLPSLERHLQMNHGINDVNKYTEHNPNSLPQVVAALQDVLLDYNQCRVCRLRFDSSSSLEKHFRTHGMAFMNSLSKSP